MLAPIPQNESQRLATLYALDLLDRGQNTNLDRICRLAKRFYRTDMASMTMIDAEVQKFLAADGLEPDPVPRHSSFCAHALLSDDILIVEDTLQDVRFFDNEYVIGPPNLRFYAGKPISAPNGVIIGTLNIADRAPRSFTPEDAVTLVDLAALAESEIRTFSMDVFDQLTGLVNRRGLQLIAEQAIARAMRQGECVSLIYVDIDKHVSTDSDSARLDDDSLCRLADVLRKYLRGSDILARFRSDEFAILLPDTTEEQTVVVKERVREAINSFTTMYETPRYIDVNIGSSTVEPSEGDLTLERLIEEAND
ncbi:MAG: sensor domain-containing diguanylate cyclase [Firmicutes bacterium]|jgi:diguanylate cyclase (GGDEF)-like protein|nr:sensor domain-containing diguanylate cyclase [Bacillota bacterium]